MHIPPKKLYPRFHASLGSSIHFHVYGIEKTRIGRLFYSKIDFNHRLRTDKNFQYYICIISLFDIGILRSESKRMRERMSGRNKETNFVTIQRKRYLDGLGKRRKKIQTIFLIKKLFVQIFSSSFPFAGGIQEFYRYGHVYIGFTKVQSNGVLR